MTNQTREGGSSGPWIFCSTAAPIVGNSPPEDGSDHNITLLYIQFCRLGRRAVECPRRLLTRGYRWAQLPRQLRLISTLITSSYLLSSIEGTQLLTANFTAGDVCLMSGIAFLTLWIRRALQ